MGRLYYLAFTLAAVLAGISGHEISLGLKSGKPVILIEKQLGTPPTTDTLECHFQVHAKSIMPGQSAAVKISVNNIELSFRDDIDVVDGKGVWGHSINDVGQQHSGVYECEVTFGGETAREEFELIVVDLKPLDSPMVVSYSTVSCEVRFDGGFAYTSPNTVSFCGVRLSRSNAQVQKMWVEGPLDEPSLGQPTWSYSSLRHGDWAATTNGDLRLHMLNNSVIKIIDLPSNETLIASCELMVLGRDNKVKKVIYEETQLLNTNEELYQNHCPAFPFAPLELLDVITYEYGFYEDKDCWNNWLHDGHIQSKASCTQKDHHSLSIGCYKDKWYTEEAGEKSVELTNEHVMQFKRDCCGTGPNHCQKAPFAEVSHYKYLQPVYGHHTVDDCEGNWYCKGDIKSDLMCLEKDSKLYKQNLTVVCHGHDWFNVKDGHITDGVLNLEALREFNKTCSGASAVAPLLLPILVSVILGVLGH